MSNFDQAGPNNSLSTTPEETLISKILNIIGKIIKIIALGYLYFFMTGISVMATDSCGVNDCRILTVAWTVGALWMALSFIVTTWSIIWDKRKITFTKLITIFMPYVAIPIFIGVMMLAMTLEGL